MITDQVRGYFGFERIPFDRSLAVSQLFASASHSEAAARIGYAIATRGLAAITGETGAGKTVAARAAIACLDASRYQVIYLPNPQVGSRGIHHAVVTALGGVPRFHHATLIPQAAAALAAETAERAGCPCSWSTRRTCCPTTSWRPSGCSPIPTSIPPRRWRPCSPASRSCGRT